YLSLIDTYLIIIIYYNGRYYDCLLAGQVLPIRYRNSRLNSASIIFDRRWQGKKASRREGRIPCNI
nr:hypothetical protein [Tanacetum cinerariifolium]